MHMHHALRFLNPWIQNDFRYCQLLHPFKELSFQCRNISFDHLLNKDDLNNNLKGSSRDWIKRQLKDQYVKKSRYDLYRCRSAYKLLEMDERFKILKPGHAVVDCGAAPGSWTQVIVKKLKLDQDNQSKGTVIAVDLLHIEPIKGAVILKGKDFTHASVQDHIYSLLPNGKADVVLSDMAPNASGVQELDGASIMNLVFNVLKFSMRTLKKDGTLLCKVWDNYDMAKMVKTLEHIFMSVKRVKPDASRSDSAEIYLLCRGYKNVKELKKSNES